VQEKGRSWGGGKRRKGGEKGGGEEGKRVRQGGGEKEQKREKHKISQNSKECENWEKGGRGIKSRGKVLLPFKPWGHSHSAPSSLGNPINRGLLKKPSSCYAKRSG